MSEAITLARPHARAAFEVARDADALDSWSEALAFAAGVADDTRTHSLVTDPRVSQQQLIDMHMPPDTAADGAFGRLLAELAHFGRLPLLPAITAAFDAYKREAEATLKISVTSAAEMDEAQREALRTSLGKRFQREIDMDISVDASLLGGVVIHAGSEVIDGSARGRLDRLAGTLTH